MGGAFPGPHARHPSPGAAVQHCQGPVPAEPRLVPLSRAPRPRAQVPDCSSGKGSLPSASVKLAVLLSPPPRPVGSLFIAALHPRDPARAPPLCLCLITGDHSPPLQPFPSVSEALGHRLGLSEQRPLPAPGQHPRGTLGRCGSSRRSPRDGPGATLACTLLGDVSRLWVTHVPGPPGRFPAAPALRGRMWVA